MENPAYEYGNRPLRIHRGHASREADGGRPIHLDDGHAGRKVGSRVKGSSHTQPNGRAQLGIIAGFVGVGILAIASLNLAISNQNALQDIRDQHTALQASLAAISDGGASIVPYPDQDNFEDRLEQLSGDIRANVTTMIDAHGTAVARTFDSRLNASTEALTATMTGMIGAANIKTAAEVEAVRTEMSTMATTLSTQLNVSSISTSSEVEAMRTEMSTEATALNARLNASREDWVSTVAELATMCAEPTIGTTPEHAATSCDMVMLHNQNAADGVYYLKFPSGLVKETYCKRVGRLGFALLFKTTANREFHYDNPVWTDTNTINPKSLNENTNENAKFDAFNHMPIQQIRLETPYGATNLALTAGKGKTLRALLAAGVSQPLTVMSGIARPTELMHGSKIGSSCGHPWRLDSFNSKTTTFKVRIGGFHSYHWKCTYGNDQNDEVTGASLAGFGFKDTSWSPFTYAEGSAGVRQAHDKTPHSLTAGSIWGR